VKAIARIEAISQSENIDSVIERIRNGIHENALGERGGLVSEEDVEFTVGTSIGDLPEKDIPAENVTGRISQGLSGD
jgi:hypothetical protein